MHDYLTFCENNVREWCKVHKDSYKKQRWCRSTIKSHLFWFEEYFVVGAGDWNSFRFTFRLAVSVQLLKPAATWKSLTLWKGDPRLIRKGSNSVCVSNSHYHLTSMQPRQSWLCHKSYPADKAQKQQAEKFSNWNAHMDGNNVRGNKNH